MPPFVLLSKFSLSLHILSLLAPKCRHMSGKLSLVSYRTLADYFHACPSNWPCELAPWCIAIKYRSGTVASLTARIIVAATRVNGAIIAA